MRIAPNEVACSNPEAIKVIIMPSSIPTTGSDRHRLSTALRAASLRYAHNCFIPLEVDICLLRIQTDFYDAWRLPRPGYPGHFPTRDEKAHAERRKIVNNVYSMSSVLESEQAVNDCTQLFMQTMREFARERKVVDIGQWLLM